MNTPVQGFSLLLLGLLLCVPPALAQTAAPSAQRKQELRNMLFQDCGSCHGLKMTGGLGPALTRQALKNKSKAYLLSTILDGRSDTPMPPWRGILNQADAEWMLDLLEQGVEYEAAQN